MTGSVGTTNDAATKIAEPLTVLDEQTQQELQPPCQYTVRRGTAYLPCESPAVWIVRVRCSAHKTRVTVACGPHLSYIASGRISCRHCRPSLVMLDLVSAERL